MVLCQIDSFSFLAFDSAVIVSKTLSILGSTTYITVKRGTSIDTLKIGMVFKEVKNQE